MEFVRSAVVRATEAMSVQANKCRCEVEVTVGLFAWLSTEHLRLAPGLTRKLAAKWAGPYRVVASVGPVAFRLALPPAWKIHDVFHVSQLCPAFGFDGSVSAHWDAAFRPAADDNDEFEVEDLLDHRSRRGSVEYLVKWKGYPVFESTWEPSTNLHCPRILSAYRQRRGLR